MKKIKLTSEKNVMRAMVVLIVVLSITAGYYHALYQTEQRKYLRLEDMYVRVRQQLGRDETQRLIDESYQLELDSY